jgi:hypothetical protein
MKQIQYPILSCVLLQAILLLLSLSFALSNESMGSYRKMCAADNIIGIPRYDDHGMISSCRGGGGSVGAATEANNVPIIFNTTKANTINATATTTNATKRQKAKTTAAAKRSKSSSTLLDKRYRRKVLKSSKQTESSSFKRIPTLLSSSSYTSSSQSTTTINLPRGTQITGAGHHTSKNRSIFAQTMNKRNHIDNSHLTHGDNPMYGRMYAKYNTADNQLLLYFPRENEMIEIMARDMEEQDDLNQSLRTTCRTKILVQYCVHDRKIQQSVVESMDHGWIPMEGIYGVYMLPSGPHLVLITNSHGVYQIPKAASAASSVVTVATANGSDDKDDSMLEPLMHLRRILSMEIVRIPFANDDTTNNKRHKSDNERRQFGVLRRALKEHEFYFTAPMSSGKDDGVVKPVPVQDVTHTLQRSFVHWASTLDRRRRRRRQETQHRVEIEGGRKDEPGNDHNGTSNNKDENQSLVRTDAGIDLQVVEPDMILNSSLILSSNLANYSVLDVGSIYTEQENGGRGGGGDGKEEKEQLDGLWAWFMRRKRVYGMGQDGLSENVVRQEEQIVESHPIELDSGINQEHVDRGDDSVTGGKEFDGYDKEVRLIRSTSWWSTMLKGDKHLDFNHDCIFQRPDSRFFWNEKCLDIFLQMYASEANDGTDKPPACHLLLDYSIPVTSAFVGVQRDIALVSKATADAPFSVKYDQLLISRRSKYRAGTRFTKRGADSLGDVANFVETEQICVVVNDTVVDKPPVLQEIYSHVQTRGSIPLRWSSPSDIKTYRPRVMIGTNPLAQARALRNHLLEQLSLYSTIVDTARIPCATLACVNLIDKHSDQGRLGRTFDSVLDAVVSSYQSIDSPETRKVQSILNPDSVSHIWFDFHAECKKGRWDRLKYLLDDVRPCLDSHGYFCAIPSSESLWEIVRLQNGVVRTNCMDCLDRTNVVQSMFGRYILFQQFCDRFGLKGVSKRKLPVGYNVAYKRKMLTLPWNTGEVAHRLLWADNADAISRLYAGTPALKGDFTRTGKRTKRGALDDGVNSVTRFYLNNFLDADRQEGIDLLTGYAKFEDSDTYGDYSEHSRRRNPRISKKKIINLFRKEKAFDSRLSLTWLPGDLQSHLRSAAFSSLAKEKEVYTYDANKRSSGVSLSAALRDIDRRAMSNDPWWIAAVDDLDQDDVQELEKESSPMQVSIMKSSGSGHVLAALIASFRAPLSTAFLYICLMIPGISKDELSQIKDY